MEYYTKWYKRNFKNKHAINIQTSFLKWYFYITKNSENQILKEIKQNFLKVQNNLTPINKHA